ncbi:MAG: hypothetical protein EHM41_15400 [Chloroflexi bacterium]|nr:MAG: hypothetical protein EHM41_15400 [Chloroflexota bacterium]
MSTFGLVNLGVKRSFRYWQLLGLWYLFYLLSAIGLAILPAVGLLDFSRNTAIEDLADGMDAWLLSDLILGGLDGAVDAGQGAVPTINPVTSLSMLGLLAILILLSLLAWLPAVFLSGGTLRTYAGAPESFNFKQFLKGCWVWFGPLIVLSLIGFAGLALLVGAALLLLPLAFSVHSILGYGLVLILVLLLFLGLVFFDMSAAALVTSGRRAIIPAIKSAFRIISGRPIPILVLFILALGLLILFHVVFRVGLFPLVPYSIWPLVLIAQQVFITIRLWTRLFRWAGGVEAVKAAGLSYS